jgi:hypothetical protein
MISRELSSTAPLRPASGISSGLKQAAGDSAIIKLFFGEGGLLKTVGYGETYG